jgi:MarR family transcriptional regulator, transcriptional regulator for hemolysin
MICYGRAVRPEHTPIGLQLTRAARVVSRAFDEALAAAGGTLPVWLVLLNLKIRSGANQRELAEAVGISGPTLTHHLNAMEADGLLARRRDPANRRNHIIELTELGEQAFLRLRATAVAFDSRLRADFQPEDLIALGTQLDRLSNNVAPSDDGPAWASLIESPADATPHERRSRSPAPPLTSTEPDR